MSTSKKKNGATNANLVIAGDIEFVVTAALDMEVIAHEADRRGVSIDTVTRRLVGEIENRLADGPRHLDGVARIDVVRGLER